MVAINGSFTNSIGHIKKTQQNKAQNISFSGQELTRNEKGDHVYKFYLPPINFDPNKDKVELELIVFDNEASREYKNIDGKAAIQVGNSDAKKLSGEILNLLERKGRPNEPKILEHEEGTNCFKFNLTQAREHIKELNDEKNSKYRIGFRIKVNGEPVIDNSQRLATANGEIFNIALDPKRALLNEVRTIYHLMPDKFNPKKTRTSKGKDIQSDHYTYNGGDLYGVKAKLDYIKELGATRMLSTPVTHAGGSHLYWTNNALQVSERLGGNKAYNELQTELYKRGMGMIADGAYVNEGWQGIHLADVYNQQGNPKDSPFFYWFDIKGFPLQAGVLPNKGDSQSSHVKMEDIVQERSKLVEGDKNSPTLLSVYEKDIIKPDEKGRVVHRKGSEVWVEYDVDKVDHNKINKYTHSAQPTVLQLSPGCEKNIEFKPANEEGQINSWDGSGIPKKRFMIPESLTDMMSPEEKKKAIVGSIQVRDDLVQIGRFWTDKVDKLLVTHTSEALASATKKVSGTTPADKIYKALVELAKDENGVAEIPPEKMQKFLADEKSAKAHIRNVLNGTYKLPPVAPQNVFDGLMSFPLDSVELPAEITRVLASPYIKCYAMKEDEIGKSRYEIYQADKDDSRYGEMDRLYPGMGKNYSKVDGFYADAALKVENILRKIDKNNEFGFYNRTTNKMTDEGKQIFRLISDDVMKYIAVESLAGTTPDEDCVKEGKAVSYKNQDLIAKTYKNLSSLHSYRHSHRNLAEYVTDKLKSGVNNINEDKLSEYIENRISKLKTTGHIEPADLVKVAKFVVDKTESGLEWRIDAAKDVADLDQVRAGNCSFDEAWDSVINTLKPMREAILKINPHSYSIFETTDVGPLMDVSKANGFGESKYSGGNLGAESEFIHGTKSTTETNYNFLYSTLQRMVHASFEKGEHSNISGSAFADMAQKLVNGWNADVGGHLTSQPLDGANYSHMMLDNHDKPRILHTFAVNVEDFFGANSQEKQNDILAAGNNVWKVRVARQNKEKNAVNQALNSDDPKVKNVLNKLVQASIDNVGWFNNDFKNDPEGGLNKVKQALTDEANGDAWLKDKGFGPNKGIYEELVNQLKQSVLDCDPEYQKLTAKEHTSALLPLLTEYERYQEDLRKAIFPAQAMKNAINDSLVKAYDEINISEDNKQVIDAVITELSGGTEKQLKETSANLAKGEEPYEENRTAELFARKPFHVNWQDIKDRAVENGAKLSDTDWKALEKKTHEFFLKPAIEKFKAILPLMVALPGSPTLFEGTELGETGAETPSKNEYVQNRQRNHFEYISKNSSEYREFIDKFQKEVKSLMNLRTQPGMSCLTNGSTIMLDEQSKTPEFDRNNKENDKNYNKSQFAFYRYNNESEVIAFFDYSGFGANREDYPKETKTVDSIDVTKIAEELKAGLKPGSIFVDAMDGKTQFVVTKDGKQVKKLGGGQIELHNGSIIMRRPTKDEELKLKEQNIQVTKQQLSRASFAYQKF